MFQHGHAGPSVCTAQEAHVHGTLSWDLALSHQVVYVHHMQICRRLQLSKHMLSRSRPLMHIQRS